jgi:hypothetical protein
MIHSGVVTIASAFPVTAFSPKAVYPSFTIHTSKADRINNASNEEE